MWKISRREVESDSPDSSQKTEQPAADTMRLITKEFGDSETPNKFREEDRNYLTPPVQNGAEYNSPATAAANYSATALTARNLHKTYGRRTVVDNVSLNVEQGEVVGLLGANGAGKTTTFYMITGLEASESGSIMIGERDVTKLPLYLRARLGLGYLPQEPSIFRGMTVSQNILAVLERMPLNRRERFARLEELMEEFGIAGVRQTRGDALSGGERRRTEIARCLATDPQFILLDEPFAGIDPKAIDDIQNIIIYLKRLGIGILITDHNVRETLDVTDRAYIMAEGRIFRAGKPDELVRDSEVRRLYLGDKFSL